MIVRNTTDGLIVVPVDHRQAAVIKFPPGHSHVESSIWPVTEIKLYEAHEIEQFGRGIKPNPDGSVSIKGGLAHFAKSHLETGALKPVTVPKKVKKTITEKVKEKKNGQDIEVEREREVEELQEGPVETLSAVEDPKAAAAIVADTHISDTLKLWKETEGRDSVRAAISERMDKFYKKSE